jgi:hypothetical protein
MDPILALIVLGMILALVALVVGSALNSSPERFGFAEWRRMAFAVSGYGSGFIPEAARNGELDRLFVGPESLLSTPSPEVVMVD